MDPMTQTVVRYVLTWGLTFLATKTGSSAWADPNLVNVLMAFASAASVAGIAVWGVYRSTKQAKVNDLAASHDIAAIHATPEIAAAADSPKVVSVPVPGSIVDTHV